jgi:hypothetical protein
MQRVCAILWRNPWPLRFHHIIRHYLKKGVIFGKRLLNIKYVFLFSPQVLSKTFLILRRIQPDIVINVIKFSCKVPVILRFYWNLNILDRFFGKRAQLSGFIKIRPVGAELFHAYGQTNVTNLVVAFRNFANASRNNYTRTCNNTGFT